MDSPLLLNFYGVTARVQADGPVRAALESLSEDFAFFRVETFTSPARLEFVLAPPLPLPPRGFPLFRTRMCRTYGLRFPRLCDYGHSTWARITRTARGKVAQVSSPNADRAYEVAYLLLLSLVGEELDLAGYHRVHALGIAGAGRTGIFILPPGGGKSAIALLLQGKKGIGLFSDEQPLVHQGRLYPFPIRMALRPSVADAILPGKSGRLFARMKFPEKRLFPIPAAEVSPPAALGFVALGKLGYTSAPGPTGLGIRVQFIAQFVIGSGIQQMAEFMLSVDQLPRIIRIAFARLKTALTLAFGPELRSFEITRDAFENTRAVEKFIQ